MGVLNDPFEVVLADQTDGTSVAPAVCGEREVRGAATACFHGFDLNETPLVGGLPGLRDELVPARSTVSLSHLRKGATVVVLCEQENPRLPIIVGILEEANGRSINLPNSSEPERRLVLSAEREVVLRCGDASITLTRAGKVIIQGTYVVSRSSGVNKIKGAAVDIN